MRSTRGTCLLVLSTLVLSTLALVVLPAGPAAANHVPPPGNPAVASGTVEGTETLENQFLDYTYSCFNVTQQSFAWQGAGTYAGKTPEGADAVYKAELAEGQSLHEGPLKFTVDTHGIYYHGPKGTHGMTDNTCSAATAGSPITGAVFTIFADDHVYRLDGGGAQVPCTGTGSWARLGADWHAQWTLDADCTVVGNAAGTPGTGIAKAQTVHTHEGIHDPCGGSCLANFHDLDYTEHPPVEGLAVNVAGAESVAIGRSATLTAVVEYNGAAQSGASVAFSVAGPGTATPASATVTTNSIGQAAFTFSGAVEGDYVVTATATSPAHPGEERSTTHTVFFSGPRPVMTLDSMPRVQNGDPATIVATIVDESDPIANTNPKDPVAGVTVSYSVAAPANGQATPATGTAVTDGDQGRAAFPFTANRAGDYTVTVTASYAGVSMTGTRTVHFDVKTFGTAAVFDVSTANPSAGAMDPSGAYHYRSAIVENVRGIAKLDLTTGQEVFNPVPGLGVFATLALIDPAGTYAYAYDAGSRTRRAVITKVNLSTFTLVGTLTLPADEYGLGFPVMDPAGDFAYFASFPAVPGQPVKNYLIKIDLNTLQRVDKILLPSFAFDFRSLMDPAGHYAYITGRTTTPQKANVTRVDLSTFQAAGSLALADDEWDIDAAVIDPAGDYAYVAVIGNFDGSRVIKADLRTMQRVGTIPLPAVGFNTSGLVSSIYSATIDPTGAFAYFSGSGGGVRVVAKVDLRSLEVVAVLPLGVGTATLNGLAFMDPDGQHAYFGAADSSSPGHVVKFDLTRAPKAALVAGNESFATPYVTPFTVPAPGVLANDTDTEDADPLVTFQPSDPPGGSVSMSADGAFTYTPDVGFTGTDTFTYQATDGIDLSPPATVSVAVGAPPVGVESVSGGACGYFTDVSLFGGPSERRGCDQTVANAGSSSPSLTLAPTGSAGPMAATKTEGAIALYGPAAIFSGIWPIDNAGPSPSGPLSVATEATTGPGGFATSSADIVLHDTPLPVRCDGDPSGTTNCTAPGGIGPGPLIANEVHSACSATESGMSASATFVEGIVETKYDAVTQLPIESEDIPDNPPVNLTIEGTLDHVGDSFRVVLNEQIVGPDSITVNAAHMYLLGPIAVGDMIVGQSRCGAEIGPPVVAVTASPSVVTAGDAVTATWSAIAAPGPTDWVGLYPTGDTPNPALISWAYTNGAPAGSLNLAVPANSPPGTTYELRLFTNNSYQGLATSGPFAVVASATTISAGPATVNPGAPVTATFSGIAAPTATDWVGLYDSPSAPEPALLNWAYTGGAGAGSLNLFVPGSAPLGTTYELRLFTNNSYTRIATSAPFSVAASTATVAATPAAVNPGAPLTATWGGVAAPTATDWVGLYDSGSTPNPGLLNWAYTNGTAAGSVNLVVPTGAPLGAAYELRLFTNNSYTRLATSAPFSVAASAAVISASPASVANGSPVTATWSGIAAPTATDWVGLYASGTDPDPAIVAWAYTGGAAAGSLNLTVPAGSPTGATYELRLYSNNSYTRLASSAPFSVT